jgi:hypothetical protein
MNCKDCKYFVVGAIQHDKSILIGRCFRYPPTDDFMLRSDKWCGEFIEKKLAVCIPVKEFTKNKQGNKK